MRVGVLEVRERSQAKGRQHGRSVSPEPPGKSHNATLVKDSETNSTVGQAQSSPHCLCVCHQIHQHLSSHMSSSSNSSSQSCASVNLSNGARCNSLGIGIAIGIWPQRPKPILIKDTDVLLLLQRHRGSPRSLHTLSKRSFAIGAGSGSLYT